MGESTHIDTNITWVPRCFLTYIINIIQVFDWYCFCVLFQYMPWMHFLAFNLSIFVELCAQNSSIMEWKEIRILEQECVYIPARRQKLLIFGWHELIVRCWWCWAVNVTPLLHQLSHPCSYKHFSSLFGLVVYYI